MLDLLKYADTLMPSVNMLSPSMVELLTDTLELHDNFNFGQFMQGENLPSHVCGFQAALKRRSEPTLEFYLSTLVGIFSGLTGNVSLRGSSFMSKDNAYNIIRGIHCLQNLDGASPFAIYWTYIAGYAANRSMATDSIEDLLVARLACLARAETDMDCKSIREAWVGLNKMDRSILAEHLFADGISEHAIMFVYLPTYLTNSSKNPVVGLGRGLTVLIDLIELMRANMQAKDRPMKVDLSDLCTLAEDAIDSSSFDIFLERVSVIVTGPDVQLKVRSAKVEPTEAKVDRIACKLKRLSREISALHSVLAAVAPSVSTVAIPVGVDDDYVSY